MKRYRLQRRLIGPVYHTNNIKRHEHAVDSVLHQVVEQLRSLNGSEVDLKEWMHIITVECLAAVSLSWSPGYLRVKSDGASGSHAYMGWRRKSVFALFPLAVILESFSRTAGRAFSRIWRVRYQTPKESFRPFFPVSICQINIIAHTALALLTIVAGRPKENMAAHQSFHAGKDAKRRSHGYGGRSDPATQGQA